MGDPLDVVVPWWMHYEADLELMDPGPSNWTFTRRGERRTVFNVECMEAIGDKIRELMAQRRRANRLERAAR